MGLGGEVAETAAQSWWIELGRQTEKYKRKDRDREKERERDPTEWKCFDRKPKEIKWNKLGWNWVEQSEMEMYKIWIFSKQADERKSANEDSGMQQTAMEIKVIINKM